MKPGILVLRYTKRLPLVVDVASRKLATATTTTLPSKYNHIRKVFDDQKYFNDFTRAGSNSTMFSTPQTGLFQNERLTTPQGLVEFSKKSLHEAKELVQEMLSEANTIDGQLKYIKKLDQLSDILCRVIDVAEFIRVVHPGQKWVNAAQQTHEIMFEFMNQLNTNVELYSNLRAILNNPAITRRLSEEEIKVGEYLKQDFERSGIHMDPQTRDNFVTITQEISLLGSQFANQISNLQSYWCTIDTQEWESIEDPQLKREIELYQSKYDGLRTPGSIYVPLIANIPYTILTNCKSDSLRKKIWISLHNSTKEQIEVLNKFVSYRALLAKMLRYKSFADYLLEHKMAKNPENVITFLSNLQSSLREKGVIDELKLLSQFKDEPHGADDVIDNIKPWDRDYLLSKLQKQKEALSSNGNVSEYFSVGTVIAGLDKLFNALYDISLVPVAALKGETWDLQQVRKVKVVDNLTGKTLGFLYLDFWSPKVFPSHFTIVCLRRLNASIGSETVDEMNELVQLDGDYQLPVVSLVCNFSKGSSFSIGRFAGIDNEKPTLLSLDQVDTIFHEMGHAMHSMIGRTELHNLSGTRCATDFVELPSVLMESFSKDPRVICELGCHYKTDEKLPAALLEDAHKHRIMLDACETFIQSKMATLDQKLHDEDIVRSLEKGLYEVDSTAIYHKVEDELRVFADKWSTWHGKFPHLFSYGAVYYSYLLDRAIADKIWHGLFAADPWSREAGKKYRESILQWGGTRDPWECLADALENEDLKKGDSTSMKIIGQDSNL
ncbi:Mitochondrial intermediate peptidase [Candida viswanathii]|uniref:Mitochondrial intermediate peptidase n=1 Tax=Candida viswanathii TaxID=5486 RepID=A0A367XZH9_9ASCO|nr:Mitochondrial intermediate peptidase [Candida viswanathii]